MIMILIIGITTITIVLLIIMKIIPASVRCIIMVITSC